MIPEIVAYCVGRRVPSVHRANAVSWLQGFAKPVQIAALRQILKTTRDPMVTRSAAYRLRHLTR